VAAASAVATALAIVGCGDPAPPPEPPPDETTYVVGGTVVGLLGTGLVLQNNGTNDLAIGANGTFAFSTKLAKGAAFAVTVKTQPSAPAQTCSVSAGMGTIGNGNISSIVVNCAADQFTIGGTATGLAGTGLILQQNGGADLMVTTNGNFAFATTVASGSPYAVTVKAQPSNPSQTCTVTNGTGVVGTGNVTNVSVSCTTNRYTIGGAVTGLSGTGLVLQNNAGDDLAVNADGSFTFATAIASGAGYAVTVKTQPTGPAQTCAVTGNSGTVAGANVTSVAVNCTTNAYTVGGTASGLLGTVVLQNNAGDNLSVSANGSFAFATPIQSGAAYAVTVLTQPGAPSQTCSLSNASGSIAAANVTDVVLTCVTNKFSVGGKVSGLQGTGLVLQDNNGDDLAISVDGNFTFATAIDSGAAYSVTVLTHPTGLSQTCTVTSGTGIVGAGNVTDVSVSCATNQYTVGGTVAGLLGSGLVVQNNGGDDLTIGANGAFTFATSVLSGNSYSVTIAAQPTNPSQTCNVVAGSGTVTNGNVVTVAINCTTNQYTIGGAVTGLSGTGLVLQNNAGDDLTVNSNGNFAFATPISSGATYSVTVKTQPTNPSQTCTVSSATGTVGGANVTTVAVSCTTNTYNIGGTVVGLNAGGLVLRNNGGDNLTINANGSFVFSTPIASGATYAVTVFTQPGDRFCSVTNGTGTVGAAHVTSVVVTCQVLYSPVGPQQNVPVANLAGWTQCYIDTYANFSTTIASIQAACPQGKIMMACRPTGSSTLTTLAWAPRTEVFTVTNNTGSCASNQGHVANGTKWYFDTSWSWGFALAGDALSLCSCDTAGTNPGSRLCWHTSGGNINSGWRCGASTGLNGAATFERIIYQSP
jgi:hypothetical protein